MRAQLEEVRASRQRIVEAGDAERRRVERDLHDGAQQRMVTLALELAMLRDRAASDPAMAASLDEAAAELKQAIAELRELARGIHPAILTEEGLPAAVEALADRSSLLVRVRADFDERLPGPVEATAYFVVAESLANVAKYAGASGARVELSRCEGWKTGSPRCAAASGWRPRREAGPASWPRSPAMPEPPPSGGKHGKEPFVPEPGGTAATAGPVSAAANVGRAPCI